MKPFWTPEGQAALQKLAKDQPLLAFDFDGTLAPIVAKPDDARVPLAIAQRLAQLSQRCPVAIVTGRTIEDVQPRLGFAPHHVVGNHGAQTKTGGVTSPPAIARLRTHLAQQATKLGEAEVQVEDKGLSFALHFRLAHDRVHALQVIDDVLGPVSEGLHRFGGKCVENVVDACAPDKGDAVVTLLQATASRSLLFIGDDINDEAVFARAQPGWLTVRVGNDDPQSRAQYFLGSQSELAALLQAVLTALS